MEQHSRMINKICAVLFILGIVILGFMTKAYKELTDTVLSSIKPINGEVISTSEAEENISKRLPKRNRIINISGSVIKILGIDNFYSRDGLYLTSDKYIVGKYNDTSTDYEYEQLVSFNKFLKNNGISFLYVNEPVKYTDDQWFKAQFGVDTYANQNADKLIKRLRESGIAVLDLREEAEKSGIRSFDMFYRTDHHWTTNTGLWAAGNIAEALNDEFSYGIDLSLYDPKRFKYYERRESWLGEQGKKLSSSLTGFDDYVEIIPEYPTDFSFIYPENVYNADFMGFINEDIFEVRCVEGEELSWYYAYTMPHSINNNIENGKILMLCDSYNQVVDPFLALGVKDIEAINYRDCKDDFDLRDYIKENGYDTIIVAYSQIMIGAHDDPRSSNYRMYSFE